jgi:LysM repeat protein
MADVGSQYEVLIKATSGNFQVTAILGQTPAQVTDGFGGWDVVDRPRRVSMTQWNGRKPFQITLPLIFDGWINDAGGYESQESSIQQLIWMSLPRQKKTTKGRTQTSYDDPTTVNIYGAIPFSGITNNNWVISNLDFGDNAIWMMLATEGASVRPVRVRQDVTVTLLQYVDPDRVVVQGANQGLSPRPIGPYIVKSGDTLRKLAVLWYGDVEMAQTIADFNGLRDTKIKKGQTLKRIP